MTMLKVGRMVGRIRINAQKHMLASFLVAGFCPVTHAQCRGWVLVLLCTRKYMWLCHRIMCPGVLQSIICAFGESKGLIASPCRWA